MGEIFTKSKKKNSVIFLSVGFTVKEAENYGSIMIPKARGVRKSCCMSVLPSREKYQRWFALRRMNGSLSFLTHIFVFSLVVEKAQKTILTQQWIHLLMENLMMQVASR